MRWRHAHQLNASSAVGYHETHMKHQNPISVRAMERALMRVREREQGQRTNIVTLHALRELIRTQPERSMEVLEACRRHLPFWTTEQQVIVGRHLFTQPGPIRTQFIKAIGPMPEQARKTLEALVATDGGHTGFAEAYARVKEFGGAQDSTFVVRTFRAAIYRAMAASNHNTQLLRTITREVPQHVLRGQWGTSSLAQDWWSAAVVARDQERERQSTAIHIVPALDALMAEGIEPNLPGQPSYAVQAALCLEDHEALVALLDRGANWQGLDIPLAMEPTLHQHPAWKRTALGQQAQDVSRIRAKPRKM